MSIHDFIAQQRALLHSTAPEAAVAATSAPMHLLEEIDLP